METLTRFQAFDLFEQHLPDVLADTKVNFKAALGYIQPPNVAHAKTRNHFWVDVNLYQLKQENVIKQYTPMIRALELRLQPKTEESIEQLDVERAKEYPIADLLNTHGKRGNVSCPFHKDKNPSFHIKKNNTFTCYSCGEYGDSIDLYQKLHNTNFLQAVKALT